MHLRGSIGWCLQGKTSNRPLFQSRSAYSYENRNRKEVVSFKYTVVLVIVIVILRRQMFFQLQSTYFLYGRVVCVCRVCVYHSIILDVRGVDVPAGVTQEEGPTGFLIHLPSAVIALIFLARRIKPFLSFVDREVEFCLLTRGPRQPCYQHWYLLCVKVY